MLFVLLPLFLFAVSVSADGCGTASPWPSSTSSKATIITPDGATRTFQVYVPMNYDSSARHPLVLLFHGYGGTGPQAEASFLFDPTADAGGAIAVYPSGIQDSWNAGGCCGYAAYNGVDDITFVTNLVAYLQSQLCVDSSRIYAAGLSNGAFLSHRIACELSSIFAAVAPVEGTSLICPCNPTEVVSVMEVQGTVDTNIPFNGGSSNGCPFHGDNFPSVPATLNAWLARIGSDCSYGNSSCTSSYLTQGDGTCISMGPGIGGTEVVYCTVQGGGHAWSGGAPGQANSPGCSGAVGTFDVNTAIWNFFVNHPKVTSSAIQNVNCPSYYLPNKGDLTAPNSTSASSSSGGMLLPSNVVSALVVLIMAALHL